MNFHPFYRNDKEVVKKEEFYTNYITVKFPVNIFTQKQANLNKVILHHLHLRNAHSDYTNT